MAGKGDIVEQALKLLAGGGDDAAKRAFANTRLKTPQGDPMRLYHMTPEDIFEFRASPENRSGPAVFLSPYPDFQPAYHQSAERGPAGELTSKFKEGANVMPVYADVRNPLVLDHPRKIKEAAAKYQGGDPQFPRIISPEARAAMEAEGYDGIVFGGDNPIPYGDRPMDARLGFQEGRGEEFLVFDPKRVKSAISNTGEYDFTNPDITKAEGGQVREGYAGKGRVVKNKVGSIVDAVTGRRPNRVFPELAKRYPEVVPPVTAFDKKKGKEYLAKDLSPEALAVQKARDVIQKDIDAGFYDPFFDVRARADVDPSDYPSTGKTIDVKPARPETQAKYRAMAFNPEGLSRLREGYAAGLEQKDVAENWYFMKQLEDKFVEEFGPEEGRKQFKERFAKPMALTTGGADPTSNLLMSYYGNFLREKGLPIPKAAYDMPFPIGGQFASSNMGMFGRNMEKELTPDNPKRFNFQNNFLGYKEPTIDEQMSKGFDPKLQMPEWYGPYEEAINMLASEYDVDPRYFQEVTWAGLKSKGKGGYQGMPMIQHVNEAIERTSRLTGVPPEEVVRRGLVRAEMPIYGMAAPAGALAVGAMGDDAEEDIDNAVRIAKGGGGGFTKLVRSLFGPSEKEGLEALTKAGSGYKGVPGKPNTVKLPGIGEVEAKPLPPLERAAEDYMKRLGRPGEHVIDVFQPLDEDFARRVAGAYGEMKHAPTDPEVKRAYDALAQETLDQLEAAKQAGIDFSFIRGEDPYKASPGMGYADLAERGHLYVFPTDQGFGSDVAFDPANNPLLKRIGPLGDLDDATVNDAFRIVHDLFGHYGPGNPFFRAPGEERAFKLHSRMYSPEARPAMASETRGQNSWLNFGPYGSYNRGANAAETIYADQKTGIMPPWAYEKADGGAIENALRIAKGGGGGFVPKVIKGGLEAVETALGKSAPNLSNTSPEMRNAYLLSKMKSSGINTPDDVWNRWRDYMMAKAGPRTGLSSVASKESHSKQVNDAMQHWRQKADTAGMSELLKNWETVPREDGFVVSAGPREIFQKAGIPPTMDNIQAAYDLLRSLNKKEDGFAPGGAVDNAIRIAKDIGGAASRDDMRATYAALEGANVPQSAAPVEPRYPDKAAQQMAAKKAYIAEAMGGIKRNREPTDLEYWNAMPPEERAEFAAQYPELGEEMRMASEVNYYENAQRAKASQPYSAQSMTHDASVPRTDMKINMPLLGGEYSLGSAPYNVAEGLQSMAQNAYDFKTMPLYFSGAAAPIALGIDVAESRLNDDPLGLALSAALTPQTAAALKTAGRSALGFARRNPKATAAVIGAGSYLSPDETEADPFANKALELTRDY
jgi:hypothetical protein